MPRGAASSGSLGAIRLAAELRSARRPAASAPERTFISVLLPAPFSPMSACTSPGAHLEVDAVERARGAEALPTPADAEQRPDGAFARSEVRGQSAGLEQRLHLGRLDVLRRRRSSRRCRCASRTGLPCRWSTSVFTPSSPILNGFCTTRPAILPAASARPRACARVEADELHLAGEPRVLRARAACRRSATRSGEDARRGLRPKRLSRFSDARCGACRGVAPPYWLDETSSMPGNFAFMAVEEAALALGGAGRALRVAQHQDLALAAEQPAPSRSAASPPPFVVVGRDEAHDPVALRAPSR